MLAKAMLESLATLKELGHWATTAEASASATATGDQQVCRAVFLKGELERVMRASGRGTRYKGHALGTR